MPVFRLVVRSRMMSGGAGVVWGGANASINVAESIDEDASSYAIQAALTQKANAHKATAYTWGNGVDLRPKSIKTMFAIKY